LTNKKEKSTIMEELRIQSRLLHPEVQSVSRDEVVESLKNHRVTDPYYTKYEYVALLGTRIQQLSEGASPLVSIDGMVTSSPLFLELVAKKEIGEKKLPFIIHRRIPNGQAEYWSTTELSVMW
jgi:DNA-directed RNA polymerase subunit K/omega